MRRTLSALAIATLAISLTGCGAGVNAETRRITQVTDGAEASIISPENNIRVPHIGWNNLIYAGGTESTKGTILEAIPEKSVAYFVHSYMLSPEDSGHRLADVDYHGINISAVIKSDNVTGTQFHPEKSGEIGLQILRNFCDS
jgi:imidazole glycerol phosphate synthase glutamine amidotransferase subunit